MSPGQLEGREGGSRASGNGAVSAKDRLRIMRAQTVVCVTFSSNSLTTPRKWEEARDRERESGQYREMRGNQLGSKAEDREQDAD